MDITSTISKKSARFVTSMGRTIAVEKILPATRDESSWLVLFDQHGEPEAAAAINRNDAILLFAAIKKIFNIKDEDLGI